MLLPNWRYYYFLIILLIKSYFHLALQLAKANHPL